MPEMPLQLPTDSSSSREAALIAEMADIPQRKMERDYRQLSALRHARDAGSDFA